MGFWSTVTIPSVRCCLANWYRELYGTYLVHHYHIFHFIRCPRSTITLCSIYVNTVTLPSTSCKPRDYRTNSVGLLCAIGANNMLYSDMLLLDIYKKPLLLYIALQKWAMGESRNFAYRLLVSWCRAAADTENFWISFLICCYIHCL